MTHPGICTAVTRLFPSRAVYEASPGGAGNEVQAENTRNTNRITPRMMVAIFVNFFIVNPL